ncbi:MAG TPA: 2-oxoglutarate oxidoreductase [Candidatus Omnitrophica bacterium]|nr:MAG: 2-oxoglutarate oxidoreductase [Candidatus Omnitrophota bacterium]RKY35835.1 MAG: 2-oxoglutarate oxidoreductase [Candidatus Omnitrophota bacterium]RKY44625.1 MAG: 2-oxoglutarate oxidoreductase [Candidatus Omnitrophota bacterium]HEC69353.1 2-oxoglutarate oxidoreductase [Candidatus Omnitrophota bacterium]
MPEFKKPQTLKDKPFHYCPGCGHGIVHRIIAEIVEELGIRERTVGVAPVGCAVVAYDYWDFDTTEAAHGRALAVATAIKRCRPQLTVFTYQGDGDLVSIGIAETLHSANRGENLTCIFINNACYGMTGGQMAPTTLIGQKTATTPQGRDPKRGEGYPLKVPELLANLKGVVYAERTSVDSPANIIKTRQAVKKAFLNQIEEKGFSLVEVLSQCPTIWGLSPVQAVKWVREVMTKEFPLGRVK